MADIAAVFHWALADMQAMPLPELMLWRGMALDRFKQMHAHG